MREEKKPYVAPRLRAIRLETREVMANACKTVDAGFGIGLPQCGLLSETPCSIDGS